LIACFLHSHTFVLTSTAHQRDRVTCDYFLSPSSDGGSYFHTSPPSTFPYFLLASGSVIRSFILSAISLLSV
jgi:hypothetical protein